MKLSAVHARGIAAVLFALGCTSFVSAQATLPMEHFAYSFSNFPWWSDTDLRAELKREIPTLGNELTRNSRLESKIRETLVGLLKAKGIEANVQVQEPDADYAAHKRVPNAPPVSIVFSVSSPPYISIDKIILDGAPSDTRDALQQAVDTRRMYSTQIFWSIQNMLTEPLNEAGYLTAKVTITPSAPVPDRNDFKVPLVAKIASGPKFHIATIKADGGPLLAGRDLSPYFAAKPGDVAPPNPFGRLAGAIRGVYLSAGYPDVEMFGEPTLDAERALASYEFRVVPGSLYHLRSIQILHFDEGHQSQVRLILKMKEGDIFDGMAVNRIYQTLRSPSSPIKGFDFTFSPKEDKTLHVVDLTLDFYKVQ